MKHIKLFESYSKPQFRIPEEVSREEFDRKINIFSKVQFTTQEKEFFRNFRGEIGDKKYDTRLLTSGNTFVIIIYHSITHNLFSQIDITKLEDDWYLIYDNSAGYRNYVGKWYICDEWEEVLGYLSNKGFNI
jgi:hypothetical protein